jgi:pyruvate carboxylase
VVGVPTNIKLMRRILAHPTFQEGKYDTGFIAQNEKTLLKKIRDPSHMRMGTIAIVKVFLESLKFRTKRASALLPWEQRDMFRLNNRSMREV